jgi:hypothetical protein
MTTRVKGCPDGPISGLIHESNFVGKQTWIQSILDQQAKPKIGGLASWSDATGIIKKR